MPITRLGIALLTCMLLFILMGGAKPAQSKKVTIVKRVKKLENGFERKYNSQGKACFVSCECLENSFNLIPSFSTV